MYKEIKNQFNETFKGMDAEYKAIIDRFRKNIDSLSQFKPEIAQERAAEEENKVRAEIQELKNKYWAKATEYLDDTNRLVESGGLKNAPKNTEELLQDNMEMMLLGKELQFMNREQIKERFQQGRDPVKRLILSSLKAGQKENSEYRMLIAEISQTPQDVIQELKGRLMTQKAYDGKVYTDAVLPHNIDDDLGASQRMRDAYFAKSDLSAAF